MATRATSLNYQIHSQKMPAGWWLLCQSTSACHWAHYAYQQLNQFIQPGKNYCGQNHNCQLRQTSWLLFPQNSLLLSFAYMGLTISNSQWPYDMLFLFILHQCPEIDYAYTYHPVCQEYFRATASIKLLCHMSAVAYSNAGFNKHEMAIISRYLLVWTASFR